MKRTQVKDALRNIRKQKVSFLSIVVIAALGVTMFLGIDFSASAIRENASSFYNEKNYRDVELVSTLLLSKDDFSAIRSTEGVRDVEGVFLTSAKASANGMRADTDVLSLTERINLPIVSEGRLPETETECAIEQSLAETLGLHTGDSVVIADARGDTAQYLRQREFVVSGVIIHPDHICSSVPSTPYVMVTQDAFDAEALDGCCMKAEIVTDRAADAARFDSAYTESVGTVLTRLNALGAIRAPIREAEVHTQAEDAISENRQKLDDAEQELYDARTELDQGYCDLRDGETQYADGVQKLIDVRAELDDAKAQLADAEQELKDARTELDDAKAQLADGERELCDARAELDDAKAQLDAGKAELDAAQKTLDDARAKLIFGWNQLEDAKAEIRAALRRAVANVCGEGTADSIPWAKKQAANPDSGNVSAAEFRITDGFYIVLDTPIDLTEQIKTFAQSDKIPYEVLQAIFYHAYPDGEYDPQTARAILADALADAAAACMADYNRMVSACSQWDRGHKSYLNGKAQYNDGLRQYEEALAVYYDGEAQYTEGLRQYEDALQAYDDGEAQYDDGLQQYEDALAAYNDGEAQYEQGVKDLEQARHDLDDAYVKLADGEAQYTDGLSQYEEGKVQLADAEEQVASLGPCKWILLDARGNASFSQLETAGNNLKSMEMTFSLLFMVVGALVIYATISKMVDEQRSLVGTTKALGFFNREILAKYLLFGVTATVLGTVLGLILAATMIQGFVLNGYNRYFSIDLLRRTVKLLPTVLVFAAGILLAVAAIWFAARKLMKESAIRLMQQAVPKGAKKTANGKKQVLSLYSRLILLNIRTDLRRVLVTVVSVAGCCALVVIGVTLRQAVKGAEIKHFEGIIRHDGFVRFDSESDTGTADAVEACIGQAGAESVPVMHTYVTVHIDNFDLLELYCGDLTQIREMYALNDAETDVPIDPSDDGIYITKRFSEIYGIQTGDTFELALNGTETAEVQVAGIFNCYMNRNLFLSERCYQRLFGRDPIPNALYVRLNGTDAETLIESLQSVEGFMSYEAADAQRTLFKSATTVLNGIVLLFIGMAGIMAGVVLMNLTNIYILQKKRELTIMRINGFTVKEVIGYVLRETYVTTAIGILLGIGLGAGIGYRIVCSLEQSFVQFDRSVSFLAWLIGAAVTIVFAIVVNAIALRKVKRLKLTDI